MLGPWEIFFLFLAILLIFGGKKIPEVARGLGKGLREFNKAKNEVKDSINEAIEEEGEENKNKKDVDTKAIDDDYKSVDKEKKSDKE